MGVKVGGAKITVSNKEEYYHKSGGEDIFKITKWGQTYNIYSSMRVWISFDGTYVNVIPAPSVKGNHCGLCGNYNRNKYDEMTEKTETLSLNPSVISFRTTSGNANSNLFAFIFMKPYFAGLITIPLLYENEINNQ